MKRARETPSGRWAALRGPLTEFRELAPALTDQDLAKAVELLRMAYADATMETLKRLRR